jgi:uncharacterized protein YndB with AHSA1/START domain
MASGSSGFTLTVTREFSATPEAVFGTLVDPRRIAEWFGPNGFRVSSVDFAPREGYRYRIELEPPEGDRFHIAGVITRADRPTVLEFSFVYDEPSADDVETRVQLVLSDVGESTEIRLTQGTFKTADRRALHETGWRESFDKLERVAAKST